VHYFGRTHLGKILGAYKISYDVAAAGAPLFTAYLYDLYGGYTVPQLWLTDFLLALLGLRSALPACGPFHLALAVSQGTETYRPD
jgi:hypothetical protein